MHSVGLVLVSRTTQNPPAQACPAFRLTQNWHATPKDSTRTNQSWGTLAGPYDLAIKLLELGQIWNVQCRTFMNS